MQATTKLIQSFLDLLTPSETSSDSLKSKMGWNLKTEQNLSLNLYSCQLLKTTVR